MPATKPKRRRRWLWLCGALLIILGATYAHLTHPARLRAALLARLQGLPLEEVDCAGVTFDPRNGLLIRGLQFVAGEPTAGPAAHVRIDTIAVPCEIGPLLVGRFRPSVIDIGDTVVRVVVPPEPHATHAYRQHGAQAELWHALRRLGKQLPPIRLPRVDLQVGLGTAAEARIVNRTALRVTGMAGPQAYNLRVDRLPALTEQVAALDFDYATGRFRWSSARTPLATLMHLLPPAVQARCAALHLDGRFALDELILQTPAGDTAGAPDAPFTLESAQLSYDALRCILPFEDAQAASAAGVPLSTVEPYVRLNNGRGVLRFARTPAAPGGTLTIDGVLALRDAALTFQVRGTGGLLRALGVLPDGLAAALVGAAPARAFDALQTARFEARHLELPAFERYPVFWRSKLLPGPVRAALRDYMPAGHVNLEVTIAPPDMSSESATRVAARLEALDARCRYDRFPYDFERVRGVVRLADGHVYFDGLTAWHGAACVTATGRLDNTEQWTGFDLTFVGRNVALNADLYAALPESYRRLWASAAPLGVCDVVTTLQRPDGSAETGSAEEDVLVDAQLTVGSLSLGEGRRLTAADGHFTIRNGRVEIHDLHGFDATTAWQLGGTVWTAANQDVRELRVEAAGMPLDMAPALGTDAEWALQFDGTADAWARVFGRDGKLDHTAVVALRDGSLAASSAAPLWTHTRGWFVARGGATAQVELRSFSATQGDATLHAAGCLPAVNGTSSAPLSVDVTGEQLERLWPQLLPPRWHGPADALGIRGAGELSLTLQPQKAGAPTPAAEIKLYAAEMQPTFLPLKLEHVEAQLALDAERFQLAALQAQWRGSASILAQGEGVWQGDGAAVNLSVAARNLELGPELAAGLPGPLGKLLNTLQARGHADALLEKVAREAGAAAGWDVRGRLLLHDAHLSLGPALRDLEGELSGTCVVNADRTVVQAELALARLRLLDRELHDWRGELQYSDADRIVRFDNLRGRLCGGEAVGSVEIDPDSAAYELTLSLRDVGVNELFPPAQPSDKPRTGRLDGTIQLRGRGTDLTLRRGSGNLRIYGTTFLQHPVLAGVAAEGDKTRNHGPIDSVNIRFLLDGNTMQLERVDLRSRDLRLIGKGVWRLDDDTIELTLVGAHPEHLPKVAVLTPLIVSAGQELVQYRVTGTLGQPSVKAEPLYRLTEALRELLAGED